MQNIGGLNLCCGLNQFSMLAMGTLKIVSLAASTANPFEVATDSYTKVLETPTYLIKQLSGRTKIELFGVDSDEYFKLVIGSTETVLNLNDIGIVTSDYQPLIKGKIARVNHLVGTIEIYINTSTQINSEALEVV